MTDRLSSFGAAAAVFKVIGKMHELLTLWPAQAGPASSPRNTQRDEQSVHQAAQTRPDRIGTPPSPAFRAMTARARPLGVERWMSAR